MRIEQALATLIAVLCVVLSAGGAGGATEAGRGAAGRSDGGRVRPTPTLNYPLHYHPHIRHPVEEDLTMETVGEWKRAKWKEMQTVLRLEGHTVNGSQSVECCPTVLEMIEPEGGMNPDGRLVDLYRHGENRQRFYEISCREDIVNRPCRFVDPRLHNQSRCTQQYSYTYALVRDPEAATETPHRHRRGERHFPALPGGAGWSLDYIKVRAGCACEVDPPPRKRKRQERHRQRKTKGKRHEVEDDET